MRPNVEKFYTRLESLLSQHSIYLRDTNRNKAYYRALKKHVKPGMKVLDIGSGTGIWAIVAAKLGAKKAVAVEKERALAGIIKMLARENSVADRVEIKRGRSRRVRLKKEFDCVVSETIGNAGINEGIVATMIDARKRFLKRDGIMIPREISIVSALARVEDDSYGGIPIKTASFQKIYSNFARWYRLNNLYDVKFVSRPGKLITFDFTRLNKEEDSFTLRTRWNIRKNTRFNAVALWTEARLADNCILKTNDARNWTNRLFMVGQVGVRKGSVAFEVELTRRMIRWFRVKIEDGRCPGVRSFSPIFATRLLIP